MSLGFAFALLLTLQSLQQVSTQTTKVDNGEVTTSPAKVIPVEWLRDKSGIVPDKNLSGDDEDQTANQTSQEMTVRPVTSAGQDDDNVTSVTTTTSPHTTLNGSSNTTKTNETLIQKDNTSSPVTPNSTLRPSTTNETYDDHTASAYPETYSTTPSPGNSTTTKITPGAFNVTRSSTSSTARGNFTTTRPSQVANSTKSPMENSTKTTFPTTTTMYNYTTTVTLNESTTASTTMNRTGGSFDVRDNSDKGIKHQNNSQAWGVILGIGVAVGIVALVIYVIVKQRNYRDFSHRKLVEEMPHEPVLRLDNSESLDLKFDGFAYYNPGLQGDNIQMTNFPKGQSK